VAVAVRAAVAGGSGDKYVIIEYRKAANYDDYPREKRAQAAPLPCEGDHEWAKRCHRSGDDAVLVDHAPAGPAELSHDD